ncbi:hypothetical protein VTJ49DRAFT_2573 [Mycothermus thermophilus]|uniref:GYF domain-containing protein n=1 Tax=Humicola insolens TaxID=85995 RepID=A0ABR3VNM1_HUMIN
MTQLTSSFASAAAGQTRDSRNGRNDSTRGSGSGDWPRSNGTRTFRRPSTTPYNNSNSNPSAAPEASQPSSTEAAPQTNANPALISSDTPSFLRYTKEELLDIYKNSFDSSLVDTSSLLMPTWNPTPQINGTQTRPWGKTSDSSHAPQDPSACWDADGTVKPISLEEMSAEEREMFATDVNSTMKPPQQNKDGSLGGPGGTSGRKTSISVGNHPSNYQGSPSTAPRPGTRRRETTDTNPFPGPSTASPTASRFARDEPWLPRRNPDVKEAISDEPEEDTTARDSTQSKPQPSLSMPRSNTTGSSAFGGGGSIWGSGGASTSMGVFGNFSLPTPGLGGIGDKRLGTGGSRLAHLIPKDSADHAPPKPSDAPSWRPRPRTDTDPFSADDGPSGPAVSSARQDNTSPTTSAADNPRRNVFDTPVKSSSGDFGMAGLSLGGQGDGNGSGSPETNPYRSPLTERDAETRGDHDADRHGQGNAGSDPQSAFGTFPRTFGTTALDGSDRSQTSSVGAKGFGSVNSFSGWPAGPSIGTPDRERAPFQSAFGSGLFGPLGDLPSPGLAGLGTVFGPPSASRLGRGKLESLFPPSMQAQMHGHDDHLGESTSDLRQPNPLGAIGRTTVGLQRESTGSPARSNRGVFEELFPSSNATQSPFTTAEPAQPALTSTVQTPSFTETAGSVAFPSNQSPAEPTPMRIMVMPDRMRWVYLDPQGILRGPFSGLEMNDWYKANFFTADLRVKRLEDPDFEPLGQLIRRIGNSREPFLVPQMGIPHGPPQASSPFAANGEIIPPLQGAFPSFGRTLTAEQQNELERRKQEEQLYQARQREFAQQHAAFGALPPIRPGVPGALHHMGSAHSLQSQPSFGSMASPIGMAPQRPLGPIGPGAGFFDPVSTMPTVPPQPPIGPAVDLYGPNLNFAERQMLAAGAQSSEALSGSNNFPGSQAPGAGSTGEPGSLRGGLPSVDELQKDEEGFKERLQEFHQLRAQFDAEQAASAAAAEANEPSEGKDDTTQREEQAGPATAGQTQPATVPASSQTAEPKKTTHTQQPEMTLTEKVRKTQADNKAKQPATDLPMPFPPPAQTTPIAAPTAQRPAAGIPAKFGDRSASGTPETTEAATLAPPPPAPWAAQASAGPKAPSLKEIQEAEAKKAAKKEEAAAAARRAALEQEAAAIREREKAVAAAANSGLPATSTWGSSSPVTAGSPWKQPATLKATGTSAGGSGAKKTLADIQREEELRKQKAKEAAAAAQATAPVSSGMGKRYADLASKTVGSSVPASPAASQGGGWSTVGAGGKVKPPPAGPTTQNRAVSVSKPSTPVVPAAKPSPKPATSLKDAKTQAMEEFKKWLNRELTRGLNGVSDIEQFAATLLEMPLDSTILSEAVYAYSTTMDGRHFAEEFVRRKKLADKGQLVDKDGGNSPVLDAKNNNGGWSEVAKKGNSHAAVKNEDAIPGFRVVHSKKKGKK